MQYPVYRGLVEHESTWADYVQTNSNGDAKGVIASKVGVDPATAGRWVRGAVTAQPLQVIAFARAYGLNPIPGLIAAGHLTADDVADSVTVQAPAGLESIATHALVDELERRIEVMSDYAGWVDAIVNGGRTPANLGAGMLRYLDPSRPPSAVRGEDFAEVLAPHVAQTATIGGSPVYGIPDEFTAARIARNVGTPSQDGEAPVKQPPAKQRTAAKKGTRKADRAPHAD